MLAEIKTLGSDVLNVIEFFVQSLILSDLPTLC